MFIVFRMINRLIAGLYSAVISNKFAFYNCQLITGT